MSIQLQIMMILMIIIKFYEILKQNKFHKNFKLNGVSFSSVDEILTHSRFFSDDIHHFLENWFSEDDFILVQTSGSTGIPN